MHLYHSISKIFKTVIMWMCAAHLKMEKKVKSSNRGSSLARMLRGAAAVVAEVVAVVVSRAASRMDPRPGTWFPGDSDSRSYHVLRSWIMSFVNPVLEPIWKR